MTLQAYKEKRRLDKTPEPAGGWPEGAQPIFVVQKHKASHLHYDFRLEIRGALKSWAVPKGPSMDPAVKRLAMLVEDHPFDYKDFEGIIPEGNYGAGTVIIWDQGTYEPAEKAKTKAEKEKILLKEFYSGKMKIILKGKKLKGGFSLVRAAERGDNSWLLVKSKDGFSSKKEITAMAKSVVSGKTLEQMSEGKTAMTWQSNRKKNRSLKKTPPGKKAAMPSSVSPMLCTLTREPLTDEEYLYEIKWDGYRIISYVNDGKVIMHSRSGLDYTKKYPLIEQVLKASGHKMVVDGEVVVLNEKGLPDFDALQLYNGHVKPIAYYIFDIIWLDGYDLRKLKLTERKEILRDLIVNNEVLRISESFEDGLRLYDQAVALNLEGIVAKKKDSEYHEGERAYNWLKTPTRKRQEFVIGGWAESDKNRSFRSLLFGAFNNGKFEWIGRSGGGYKDKEMPDILQKLKKIEIKNSPFVNKVLDTKGAIIHYVKPQLVANFEFATWTKSGRIRKPATFLGFRNDKKAKDVVREVPSSVDVIEKEIEQEEKAAHAASKPKTDRKHLPSVAGSNWRDLEKIKIEAEEEITLGDCTITVSDVGRMVWKDIPKARLIEYYHSVSKYMLPHLQDRPLSLHVKPHTATAPGLYIKDMEKRQPDCAAIFSDERRHKKAGKRNRIDYLVCNNEATLLYQINLGCVDINPWMSRTVSPESPDFVNIDLDPSDDDFNKAIETARAAKEVLQKLKLTSFVKTSGKTGIHIYIPVKDFSFAQARAYAELLGEMIQALVPDITTLEISKNLRGTKLLIDPSQNDYADTLAAAYSVRPYRIPSVSTPLEWKEIKAGLDPAGFTIDTILKRLEKKGELFADIFNQTHRAKNSEVLGRL